MVDRLRSFMLAGLGMAEKDHVRFTRSQVGLLDALLASQPEASYDELFLKARDELRKFEGNHVAACHYPVEKWPISEEELRRPFGGRAVASG